MHPSLAAKYRLPTALDAAIAGHFVVSMKRANWTDKQLDEFMRFYTVGLEDLDQVDLRHDAIWYALVRLQKLKKITRQQYQDAIAWHSEFDKFVDKHPGQLPSQTQSAA